MQSNQSRKPNKNNKNRQINVSLISFEVSVDIKIVSFFVAFGVVSVSIFGSSDGVVVVCCVVVLRLGIGNLAAVPKVVSLPHVNIDIRRRVWCIIYRCFWRSVCICLWIHPCRLSCMTFICVCVRYLSSFKITCQIYKKSPMQLLYTRLL